MRTLSLALFAALAIACQAQPLPDPDLTAAERRSIAEAFAKVIETDYVLAEPAKKMAAAIRGHIARGDYDSVVPAEAFVERLTRDARAVHDDRHLRVAISTRPILADHHPDKPPPAEDKAAFQAMARRNNFGLTTAKILEGNVERYAGGKLPGPRYDKKVWVLTSRRTFSGGEELAYDLQAFKRATLVGELTGGGAHPTGAFRIHDRFLAYIPFRQSINPVTKTNWEGIGVKPDVAVPADQALDVAHAAALGADQSIAAEVAEFAESRNFSGVVLLAKDGKPFLHRAFGAGKTLDSKFNLASVNKMWTMAAIARLASEGKLACDDRVGKHLPDYPNADVREKVTIEQLLTHRSGLGDFFSPEYMKAQPVKLREFVPYFANDKLEFEPGTSRGYSNAGYIVLGLIIERASGRDYFDYIGETILQPLGMTGTSFAGKPHNDFIPRHGSSAGGAWSTAADMLRFAEWLRRRERPKGLPSDGDLSGHSGGIEGASADVYMFGSGYVVVVVSDQDPPASHDVARLARKLIEAKGKSTPGR